MSEMRPLLRLPGLLAYFVVSQCARVGFAALVPGLLLVAANRRSHGYGLAGIAVSALAVGNLISGPWKAKLIDRHGMRRPLVLMAIGSGISIAALLVAIEHGGGWYDPLLVLGAFGLGLCRPALGTYSRLLWARSLDPEKDGGVLLKQAMAVESTLSGSAIVLGPLLLSGLVYAGGATVAFTAVAVLVMASTATLSGLRAVKELKPSEEPATSFPLRQLLEDWETLLGSAALYGALAGVPLVVVAKADTLTSSLLISALAGGALVAAVVASHPALKTRALIVVGPLVATAMVGLMLADTVPLVVAVAGFGAGCGLVEIALSMRGLAPSQQAVLLSWRTNAGALGQAAGAAAVGLCVAHDPRLGLVIVAALVLLSGAAGGGLASLRRSDEVAEADAAELERRGRNERPDAGKVGHDAQLDPGLGVPEQEVT